MKPEVGKKVKLLSKMVNYDSPWMPEEDIKVGSIGTIKRINCVGRPENHVIDVQWENGKRMAILPYIDNFEVIE